MTLMKKAVGNIRNQEKEQIIIELLKRNIWTVNEVAQMALQHQKRQPTHHFLMRMEKAGLIKRYLAPQEIGRAKTIWYLSQHGLMMSVSDDENFTDIRAFEASKFNARIMDHEIVLQKVYVATSRLGWKNWKVGGWQAKGLKSPDALVTNLDNKGVCIEVELTFKSYKRYTDILLSHLKALAASHYNKVLYIAPDTAMTEKLEKIFSSIERLKYKGQFVELTDQHLAPFEFTTIEEILTTDH